MAFLLGAMQASVSALLTDLLHGLHSVLVLGSVALYWQGVIGVDGGVGVEGGVGVLVGVGVGVGVTDWVTTL